MWHLRPVSRAFYTHLLFGEGGRNPKFLGLALRSSASSLSTPLAIYRSRDKFLRFAARADQDYEPSAGLGRRFERLRKRRKFEAHKANPHDGNWGPIALSEE